MAGYRQIHTQIWKDDWFIELDGDEKLLFIYLFSNDLASISGLYKIPLRVIANETGLKREFAEKTLAKFREAGKVFYEDGILWVVNMSKYHKNASPHTQKKVIDDVLSIPEHPIRQRCIQYLRDMGIVSILNSEIVSVSVSENIIVNENGSASENGRGEAKLSDYALRVFHAVTGMFSIPSSEIDKVLPAMEGLFYQHGQNEAALIEYLKIYWEHWKTGRNKSGRPFSRTNCSWLYNWAVAGELPDLSSGAGPPSATGKKQSFAEYLAEHEDDDG